MRAFLIVAVAAAGLSFPAEAAPVSRDTLERMMLDSCVYRQFQEKDIRRETLVDRCRCASKAALSGFEGETFDIGRSGKLSGPQEKAVQAGIAACFK